MAGHSPPSFTLTAFIAEAQHRGRGSVGKQVPQVRVAGAARGLNAPQVVALVTVVAHQVVGQLRRERRPPAVRFKILSRVEENGSTADAGVAGGGLPDWARVVMVDQASIVVLAVADCRSNVELTRDMHIDVKKSSSFSMT